MNMVSHRKSLLYVLILLPLPGLRSGGPDDQLGSTTMTLGTRLVTTPSDPTGERPIGDAVVLLR